MKVDCYALGRLKGSFWCCYLLPNQDSSCSTRYKSFETQLGHYVFRDLLDWAPELHHWSVTAPIRDQFL